VKDAPTFDQILGHLLRRLAGRVVVAHNADFDGSFLWAECFSARLELPVMPALCTVKLARSLQPAAGSFKLDACCSRLGVHFEDHHTALGDCRAAVAILKTWILRNRQSSPRGVFFPARLPQLPTLIAPVALFPR
jgi:DNA polymerase-3 subunit epsilon